MRKAMALCALIMVLCGRARLQVASQTVEKASLFWSARDLQDYALGNHHFILIVFHDSGLARRLGVTVLQEDNLHFLTLGVYENEAMGTLELRRNYWTDVQAVREGHAPERHVHWYARDFDLESHRIKIPSGKTEEQMIRRLLGLADIFERNALSQKPKYTPEDNNCSAWVNKMLQLAGISEAERLELGEFDGIDWGEEDLLEDKLFQN